MNSNISIKRTPTLKCGVAIKLLSIIALVCAVLSHISDFFYYDVEYINGEWVYKNELMFRFLDFVPLIFLLASIAPFILFVIYIFRFHNELKATVLIPIVFGLLPISFLIGYTCNLLFVHYLFVLLIFVACVLAVISILKGFNKKLFVIIPMSLCLLYKVLSIINFFQKLDWYIECSTYLYVFTYPLDIIGSTLLCISLLLFGVKNKIPPIIALSPEKERARVEKMNPERALKLLRYKFDLGMITEEEYQAQRAEIISKL